MAIFARNRANEQMSHRFAGLMGAMTLTIALASMNPARVDGQTRWSQPRTPDGQPDLQGIWSNATITPLERPDDVAGKPVLTEKEAAEYEKEVVRRTNVDRREGIGTDLDVARAYNNFWYDRGTKIVG